MSHRIEKKLPLERRVYTADVPADHSIDRVIEDIKAAHHLGLPFKLTTTHRRGFRGGGNVNKADIYEYSLEIGVLTEVD